MRSRSAIGLRARFTSARFTTVARANAPRITKRSLGLSLHRCFPTRRKATATINPFAPMILRTSGMRSTAWRPDFNLRESGLQGDAIVGMLVDATFSLLYDQGRDHAEHSM